MARAHQAKRDDSTKSQILDVAQRLIQSRGYNGFSYKDLAEALAIRTASIHYHFPTKADLGVGLLQRYRRDFANELAAIVASATDPRRALERFAELFQRTFNADSRLCLCGMLSAEIATLPEAVAAEVEKFFHETEQWVAASLAAGQKSGAVRFTGSPQAQARLLIAMLEGAMVVARGMRARNSFQRMVHDYLRNLRPD